MTRSVLGHQLKLSLPGSASLADLPQHTDQRDHLLAALLKVSSEGVVIAERDVSTVHS